MVPAWRTGSAQCAPRATDFGTQGLRLFATGLLGIGHEVLTVRVLSRAPRGGYAVVSFTSKLSK